MQVAYKTWQDKCHARRQKNDGIAAHMLLQGILAGSRGLSEYTNPSYPHH